MEESPELEEARIARLAIVAELVRRGFPLDAFPLSRSDAQGILFANAALGEHKRSGAE